MWAREPKVTSTEPLSLSTVPLENPPLRWIPFMTALMLEMSTGPSAMFAELILT